MGINRLGTGHERRSLQSSLCTPKDTKKRNRRGRRQEWLYTRVRAQGWWRSLRMGWRNGWLWHRCSRLVFARQLSRLTEGNVNVGGVLVLSSKYCKQKRFWAQRLSQQERSLPVDTATAAWVCSLYVVHCCGRFSTRTGRTGALFRFSLP